MDHRGRFLRIQCVRRVKNNSVFEIREEKKRFNDFLQNVTKEGRVRQGEFAQQVNLNPNPMKCPNLHDGVFLY